MTAMSYAERCDMLVTEDTNVWFDDLSKNEARYVLRLSIAHLRHAYYSGMTEDESDRAIRLYLRRLLHVQSDANSALLWSQFEKRVVEIQVKDPIRFDIREWPPCE